MIIKKFQANTETDAIMLAKEELGKDAIVMNIKTISPKGIYRLFRKPLVEITAAIDDTSTYKNDKTAQVKKQKFPDIIYDASQVETVTKQSDLQTSKMYGTRETSAIEEKLNNLQSLLEKQMLENEENNKEDNSPLNKNLTCIQLIYNQLVRNEVDEKYANQIISEI